MAYHTGELRAAANTAPRHRGHGSGLLGFSAAAKYVVTALVLLAAVTIDALARRGRTVS